MTDEKIEFGYQACKLRVYGTPVPQGSMKGFVINGRAAITSDNTKLKPWRESVKSAAADMSPYWRKFDQPVSIEILFYMPRPKSYPKRIRFPFRKPDLDKLVRGVFDALTEASVWVDDALVVDLIARKRFATDGVPMGCVIHIETIKGEE